MNFRPRGTFPNQELMRKLFSCWVTNRMRGSHSWMNLNIYQKSDNDILGWSCQQAWMFESRTQMVMVPSNRYAGSVSPPLESTNLKPNLFPWYSKVSRCQFKISCHSKPFLAPWVALSESAITVRSSWILAIVSKIHLPWCIVLMRFQRSLPAILCLCDYILAAGFERSVTG